MEEWSFRNKVEHPARDSCIPRFLIFWAIYHADFLIKAGKRTRELIKMQIRPSDNSNPKLAVPAWGETARLPKLAAVVNELKTTARAVLDLRNANSPLDVEKR